MQSFSDIATSRYRSISNRTNSNIELPEEIETLITGSDFWRNAKTNRYKKLIREGHLNDLLEIAKMSAAKDKPSHWFAKLASKAEWERTLETLAKAREVAKAVAEVVKRISVPKTDMNVVYKACWLKGQSVIRHAVTASEVGRDKFKLFCWLVWKGESWQNSQASTNA